jgi:hypothetical protein
MARLEYFKARLDLMMALVDVIIYPEREFKGHLRC